MDLLKVERMADVQEFYRGPWTSRCGGKNWDGSPEAANVLPPPALLTLMMGCPRTSANRSPIILAWVFSTPPAPLQ